MSDIDDWEVRGHNICLCLTINQRIMHSVEIATRNKLPNTSKLQRLELAPRQMELTAGVLANHFVWIEELLQPVREGECTSRRLCKLPECSQVAGFAIVGDQDPYVIIAEVSVDKLSEIESVLVISGD
jgi:hypothetical protein